jgi:hypothetical protein
MAKAAPGAWSEYAMSMPGQAEARSLKYTVTEKTPKQITLQMEFQTPMGPAMSRLVFQPAADGSWAVAKASRQPPGGESKEVPAAQLPPIKITKTDAGTTLLGNEKLTTPAGTFETRHLRKTSPQGHYDLWVSDKVAPTGIVKLTDPRGLEMRLKAMGAQAPPKTK